MLPIALTVTVTSFQQELKYHAALAEQQSGI